MFDFFEAAIGAIVGFASALVSSALNIPELNQFAATLACEFGSPSFCAGFTFGSTLGSGGSLGDSLLAGVDAFYNGYRSPSGGIGGGQPSYVMYFTSPDGGGGQPPGRTQDEGGRQEFHVWITVARILAGTDTEATGGKYANGAATESFEQTHGGNQVAATQSWSDLLKGYLRHDHKKRIPIDDDQRAAAMAGDAERFWELREEAGDPVAPTALQVVRDEGFRGGFANAWLRYRARKAGLSLNVDELQVALARAHVMATDEDGNTRLSGIQIAEYHHVELADFNLDSRDFGGTILTGRAWEAFVTQIVWCPTCPIL